MVSEETLARNSGSRPATPASSNEEGRRSCGACDARLVVFDARRGKVAVSVGPTEYSAFTSNPVEVAVHETEIPAHWGSVWAGIAGLAKRGTRVKRHPPRGAGDLAGPPAPRAEPEAVAG
jgi:hypothetical protein